MSRLAIWGAGGHGRVVAAAARAAGNDLVFVDDHRSRQGIRVLDRPILAPEELDESGVRFVVAVGDNTTRARCFERATALHWTPAIVVHPTAVVDPDARIGPGTVVMAGAIVNTGAEIGRNCIINTGAIVEHDCLIGDHAHISPGVVLGGGVHIGERTHVGLNATVLPQVQIGRNTVLGAGSVVVISSVPDNVTAVGVPARILR